MSGLTERDIHRVRFAEAIDRAGISLDDLARLVADGEYSFSLIEGGLPESGWPLVDATFGDLAASLGLRWETVEQIYANRGLTSPDPAQRLREDDEHILRGRAEVRDAAGMDDKSLVAATRFLVRDGDYFGGTVNTAARIADYARPREVLVSRDVVAQAEGAAAFEPIGDIGLRGIVDPVALFRAVFRDSSPAD